MSNTLPFGQYDRITIHTPHAGTVLPIHYVKENHPDAVESNRSGQLYLRPLCMQLTDHYTDKLFSCVF